MGDNETTSPVTICRYCKKEISGHAIFCQFCGHNVTSATLETGLVLQERYKIVKSQGAGGMASVYLAEDLNLNNTKCIIKVMSDTFKDLEKRNYAITKFKEEAVILARLRHPSLPVVQNHFIEAGRYYLVMDYVEGRTMEEILDGALKNNIFLDEGTVLEWGIQICEVFEYLHNHKPMIVHRDIKPSNLIRKNDGKIMLLDFGVAHIFEDRETGTSVGTLGFAPPEQMAGCAYTQSDIFALGATLHRLLTGYDPSLNRGNIFEYPPMAKFRNDLTAGVQEIISMAMELDYRDRFPTAAHFREALVMAREKPGDIADFILSVKAASENNEPRDAACAMPDQAVDADSTAVPQGVESLPPRFVGEMYDTLDAWLVGLLGPVAETVLADCAQKQGFSRDNATTGSLESLVEMFCSRFNLTMEQVAAISEKLQELKRLAGKKYSTSKEQTFIQEKGISLYEEFKSFLVSFLGPIAEMVLDDCTGKLGFNSDTATVSDLESVLEMFCSRFNLTSEQISDISGKLQELKARAQAPPPVTAVSAVNIYEELTAYLVTLLGPVAEIVMDDCAKKLGYTKDTFSTDLLESVLEMFCSKFNLSSQQIEGISNKLHELKEMAQGSSRTSQGAHVDIYKELNAYLVAQFGPVAEMVLDDCIGRLGQTKDTVQPAMVESIAEMFASKFKFTTGQMAGLAEKVHALSALPGKQAGLVKEPPREVNVVAELKNYLVSMAGPVGESAFASCIAMLGYTEATFPLFAFDSFVEVFISKFTFTDDKIIEIRKKAKELKNLGLSAAGLVTGATGTQTRSGSTGQTNITMNYLDKIRNK